MEDGFNIGDIVLSKMGRDSGRHYIVVSTDENYVFISIHFCIDLLKL